MREYQNKINIIMIGHTGAGKGQLGNSILQNEFFKVGHTFKSETPIKTDGFGALNNLELRIIDTCGFSYTEDKDHKDDWKKIADLFVNEKSIDGILFAFNFKETRKGQQYKDLIQKLKDIFGTEDNYVIPVQSLTHENELVKGFQWMMDHEEEIRTHYDKMMHEYVNQVYKIREIMKV